MQCQPSGIEIELLHHFMTRKEGPVKDKAREAAPEGKKAKTDHGLLEWLKVCSHLTSGPFFKKQHFHYLLCEREKNLTL